MKTFQQNNITYLAVEVPEGAYNFLIVGGYVFGDSLVLLQYRVIHAHRQFEINKSGRGSNYSIIGLLSEITEEQAKEMVEIVRGDGYVNYLLNGLNYLSAKNSLYSRLRSLGFETENILIIKQLT